MGRKLYIFDRESISAKNVTRTVWSFLKRVLTVFAVSVSVSVVLYLVVSLFVSTDAEKSLMRENQEYARMYAALRERQDLLSEVLESMRWKDEEIYRTIFSTDAPSVDPVSSLDFLFGADTIPDGKIVSYTAAKADALLAASAVVEEDFARICRLLSRDGSRRPPMVLPVAGASYPQIGAGTGLRLNPFYKIDAEHRGLDIVAPQGEPVLAGGDGTVKEVQFSKKGEGHSIEIDHGNGYVTRYLHLTDIDVSAGSRVQCARKIGTVGITGNSFASHLHYEVLLDGEPQNPVDYFFASIGPDEYSNMLYMALNTRQSMD